MKTLTNRIIAQVSLGQAIASKKLLKFILFFIYLLFKHSYLEIDVLLYYKYR